MCGKQQGWRSCDVLALDLRLAFFSAHLVVLHDNALMRSLHDKAAYAHLAMLAFFIMLNMYVFCVRQPYLRTLSNLLSQTY